MKMIAMVLVGVLTLTGCGNFTERPPYAGDPDAASFDRPDADAGDASDASSDADADSSSEAGDPDAG